MHFSTYSNSVLFIHVKTHNRDVCYLKQWSDSEESSRRLSRVTAYAERESLVALGSDQKPVIDSFIQCKAGRQKEASP